MKKKPVMSVQMLVSAAFLTAMSIVLGKLLAVNITPMIRISFENLPILLAAMMFGPIAGALVGICADIIGCILVGYAIIPIITVGAAFLGLVTGIVYRLFKAPGKYGCIISALAGHFIGSMIIKSIGLYIAYDFPPVIFLIRIGIYLAMSIIEGGIVYLLLRSDAVSRLAGGIKK